MTTRVSVVGPKGCGKTVYLSCLVRAAAVMGRGALRVGEDRAGEYRGDLATVANDVLSGRNPGATVAPRWSRLRVGLEGARLGDLGSLDVPIEVTDLPGEDSLPPPGGRPSTAAVEAVAKSDGILLLVPADLDDDGAEALGSGLARLFEAAAATRGVGRDRPLFMRMAAGITKTELLYLEDGPRAKQELQRTAAHQSEVVRYFEEIAGANCLKLLRGATAKGGVHVSFVSAYGFIPSGRPACVRDGQGWKLPVHDGEEFFEGWRPFGVFEPLEFLAAGRVTRTP